MSLSTPILTASSEISTCLDDCCAPAVVNRHRRLLRACGARLKNGAATQLPSSVMNSRRLILNSCWAEAHIFNIQTIARQDPQRYGDIHGTAPLRYGPSLLQRRWRLP